MLLCLWSDFVCWFGLFCLCTSYLEWIRDQEPAVWMVFIMFLFLIDVEPWVMISSEAFLNSSPCFSVSVVWNSCWAQYVSLLLLKCACGVHCQAASNYSLIRPSDCHFPLHNLNSIDQWVISFSLVCVEVSDFSAIFSSLIGGGFGIKYDLSVPFIQISCSQVYCVTFVCARTASVIKINALKYSLSSLGKKGTFWIYPGIYQYSTL